MRALANQARTDLLTRVDALLDEEADRYLNRLTATGAGADTPQALREAGARVEAARTRAALTVTREGVNP